MNYLYYVAGAVLVLLGGAILWWAWHAGKQSPDSVGDVNEGGASARGESKRAAVSSGRGSLDKKRSLEAKLTQSIIDEHARHESALSDLREKLLQVREEISSFAVAAGATEEIVSDGAGEASAPEIDKRARRAAEREEAKRVKAVNAEQARLSKEDAKRAKVEDRQAQKAAAALRRSTKKGEGASDGEEDGSIAGIAAAGAITEQVRDDVFVPVDEARVTESSVGAIPSAEEPVVDEVAGQSSVEPTEEPTELIGESATVAALAEANTSDGIEAYEDTPVSNKAAERAALAEAKRAEVARKNEEKAQAKANAAATREQQKADAAATREQKKAATAAARLAKAEARKNAREEKKLRRNKGKSAAAEEGAALREAKAQQRGGGARILGGGATAAAPTSAPVGDYDSPSDAHSDSGDLKEEAPSQVSEKDLAQIAEQERQLLAKSEQDRQKAARRAEKSMDDARKRAIRLGFVDEEDEDEIIEPIDLVPSLPSASLGQDAYDWRSAGLPEAIPRRRS